jgi:hypothetical protein
VRWTRLHFDLRVPSRTALGKLLADDRIDSIFVSDDGGTVLLKYLPNAGEGFAVPEGFAVSKASRTG